MQEAFVDSLFAEIYVGYFANIHEIYKADRNPDTRNINLLSDRVVLSEFWILKGIEVHLIYFKCLGADMAYPICSIPGICMWFFPSKSPEFLWSPPSLLFNDYRWIFPRA